MRGRPPRIDSVTIKGRRLLSGVIESVTGVELDLSTNEVSQMSITVEDPGFEVLKSGFFDVGSAVNYKGLQLVVSVLETSSGGGMGGLTVQCRPKAVSALKKLRAPKVMRNASPTAYVLAECKSAGVRAVAQASKPRARIARDQPEPGQTYDAAATPSAWTTMQRLAGELGYALYEAKGVVYFGKPTWLVARQPKVQVQWYPANGKEPYSIPEFRRSEDSTDVEVRVELPLDRADDFAPGYGISFPSFPKFAGTYFITNVNYPLIGPGKVSVSASTVKNPEPQRGGEQP